MQDIHIHLYWESYDLDRDEVVSRARQAGVREMLVIGCTVEESRQAIATAEKYPDMYASVGLHPNELNHESGIMNQEWIQELKILAQHEKVVAIGECGLEYYSHDPKRSISEEQKAVQKKAFLAQIALAEELKLPLIVHCRPSLGTQDAYSDLFEILKAKSFQLKAVLHCYMGDTEVTKQFLTLPNVYFSFTGNITYPVKKAVLGLPAEAARGALLAGTRDDLTETVKLVPLERIFAETDCPFLTPQSHRGERNEPAYMVETLVCIAKLQGRDASAVERATEANFTRVFSKRVS